MSSAASHVSSGLTFEREMIGTAVVVRVSGELDMATSESFEDEVESAGAVAVPPAPVVLDLTGVRFLASMGLAQLVILHDRCAERGAPLRLVATHRQVLRPIEITGLDRKLVIVPTVEQALSH